MSIWQPYAMSNKQLTDAIISNGERKTVAYGEIEEV